MFIWTAYTQEEYRDWNIVDGCAFMCNGCDKLNELAHYYNIYKKSNQGTMWKRQVIQFMTWMRDWDISLCNDQHEHAAVGYTCKVW